MSRHRQRPPVVAILFLIAFLVSVLYFLGSRQLDNSKAHRLRLLAGFADRVESTVPDLAERFARIVEETERLPLCPERPEGSTPPRSPCREAKAEEYVEQIPNLSFVSDEESGVSGESVVPAIELRPLGRDLYIIHRKRLDRGRLETSGERIREVRAKLDLEALLAPAVLPNVFESLFVASMASEPEALGGEERSSGAVLFQRGEPELRLTSLKPIFGTVDGMKEDEDSRSFVRGQDLETSMVDFPEDPATGSIPVRVAETEYRLFLQPIVLELPHLRHEQSPRPVRWVAGGFVSRDRLLSASLTTSPVLLGLLLAIFPLAVVAWPFLKLWLVSPRQQIKRTDAVFLVLAMFLGCILIALLTLTLNLMARNRLEVDQRLEGLSQALEDGFWQELERAYWQLQALDDRTIREQIANRKLVGALQEEGSTNTVGDTMQLESIPLPEGLYAARPEDLNVELCLHPVFHSVFWVDGLGAQKLKLALRPHSQLSANVSERPYFQCASGRAEPFLVRFSPDEPHAPAVPLCLQSVISNTGGADQTILALPPGSRIGDGSPGEEKSASPCVSDGECHPIMATRFASLTEPWLPSAYGFAIVDTSEPGRARVLFHSDTRRILSEDLLKASDEDTVLKAMLDNRREGSLTIHYWGERYRARVMPLQGLPWSLVTFRNLQDLRLRTIEVLYDLFNPLLVFTLAVLVVFGLLMLLVRHRVRGALWPDPRKNPGYLMIVLLVMISTAGYTLLLTLEILVYPMLAAALVWLTLLLSAFLVTASLGILAWIHDQRYVANRWIEGSNRWRRAGTWISRTFEQPWSVLSSRQGVRWTAGLVIALMLGSLLVERSVAVTLLRGAVLSMAIYLLWVRKNFEGNQRRRSYVFAMACLLFGATVLPATGLFVLAKQRQRTFILQDLQEDLAQSRERAIAETWGSRQEGAFFADYRQVLEHNWSRQVQSLFATEVASCDAPGVECAGPEPTWPWEGQTSATFTARPVPVNDLSAAPQGVDLSRFENSPRRRWWIEGGEGAKTYLKGVVPDELDSGEEWLWTSTLSLGGFPGLRFHHFVRVRALAVGALFLVTILFPFLLVSFLAQRLLFVSLAGVDPRQGTQPEDSESDDDEPDVRDLGNLRELLSPQRLVDAVEHKALVVLGVPRLALEALGDAEQYHSVHWQNLSPQELIRLPPTDSKAVVIVGLWPTLDEPKVELERLKALEQLLRRGERAVVILSQLDPSWLVKDEPEPTDDVTAVAVRRQWISLLGTFTFWYAVDRGEKGFRDKLKTRLYEVSRRFRAPWRDRINVTYEVFDILYSECSPTRRLQQIGEELMEGIRAKEYEAFTEDKLIGKIALAARSYYQAIWSSTSEQEKVVLAQLAHEGLVSPRNHGVVLDLMYRGLIVRDPELKLMNDSFALFIRQTAGQTKLLEWEAEEATSLWSILRWLLPVPLLLLGAFLFVTQRDAVSSAVGFVLAAASVAPTLVNLFGYFEQRFARGTAEKEAKAGAA